MQALNHPELDNPFTSEPFDVFARMHLGAVSYIGFPHLVEAKVSTIYLPLKIYRVIHLYCRWFQ